MKKAWIYLTQTDTTVGLLSCDAIRLAEVKDRPSAQPFLKACGRLAQTVRIGRVPPRFRPMVRRSEKTSFILPNGRSFRRVTGPHADFLELTGPCYTTSANLHGRPLDTTWAKGAADVVIEGPEGLHEGPPSTIWRLGRKKRVKRR